ncbi:MAG: DUF4328 domain-containing protein [Thermoguttaceae bacterium]|jgi:hypothetical protein|nr:DUF4328 domain-containing protein [Thermoguttaceae bacterium]
MNTDDNPYRSPQVPAAEIAATDSTRPESWARYPFVSGHTRAAWTVGLLALGIVADLLGIGSTLLQVNLLNRAATIGIDEDEATLNDLRQGVIGLTQSFVYIASAVAFLMWIHRAYRNLPPLGATGLKHSPGWAVGYFFIPIVNLYRPYQAAREIWLGSYPRRASDELSSYGLTPSAALVGWWWAFWLIMNFTGQISMRLTLQGESIEMLLAGSWASIVTDLISVPAAILAIMLVWGIDANQTARHGEIVGAGPATMASPVAFNL